MTRASFVVALSRPLYFARKFNHFPALLWRNPTHFLFPKPVGNIKLDHLCHSHPPIQRAVSDFVVLVTRAETAGYYLVRCKNPRIREELLSKLRLGRLKTNVRLT